MTPYDKVEYFSHPISKSHPAHLNVIAQLFGLQPPSVEKCRVLELGCGDGGNILPLASTYPEAQFLGIDLSKQAIKRGDDLIKESKLSNIELVACDLLEFDPAKESYDYVITHGLYSWVPDNVKKRTLEIIRSALAPNGIAFLSFNTLPGWHQRCLTREFMTFHTAGMEAPKLRVSQARAAVEFLADAASYRSLVYRMVLAEEKDTISKLTDWHLAHEYLEETNDPRYFVTFVEEIELAGLQYLADAELSQMLPLEFPEEVQDRITKLSRDVIRLEQYLDFLRNRMFRRSLLVRNDVEIRREFKAEDVMNLNVASPMRSTLNELSQRHFKHPNGGGITADNSITTRALEELERVYPGDLHFEELCRTVGATTQNARFTLAAGILKCVISDLLVLRPSTAPISISYGEKPEATSLAKIQAAKGPVVVNNLHEEVSLQDETRKLIQLLDGTRSLNDLKQSFPDFRFYATDSEKEALLKIWLNELCKLGLIISAH